MNDLLATWENELSTPVAKKLYDLRDDLAKDFTKNNSLTLESIIKVIGKPPVIPSSPDMDTMLEGWESRAEYGRQANIIEQLIKEYAS